MGLFRVVPWSWRLGRRYHALPGLTRATWTVAPLSKTFPTDAHATARALVLTLGARSRWLRVSTEGGGQPRWRGDGRELFYVAPDGRLMAVDVRAAAGHVEVGLPKALFGGVNPDPGTDHYAVTADGSRFLVPVPVGDNPAARIHVVTNWTSLLK